MRKYFPSKSSSLTWLLPAVIALPAIFAGIPAARAVEPWEQLLDLQLQDERRCTLAGTLFVREVPVGNEVTISGRAKCFDGRLFDFSQQKPHMKFEIRACEPTVCSNQ